MPRRVVTQPEYALPEYRSYRQREYSTQPLAEGFIRIREQDSDRGHYEEFPREYSTRPPSVRHEMYRYETERENLRRVSSVRPEPILHEPVPNGRAEVLRERPAASVREYSARPMEIVPSRDHTTDRVYYDPGRRSDEIAYIEHPRQREASVIVYTDGAQRELRELYI